MTEDSGRRGRATDWWTGSENGMRWTGWSSPRRGMAAGLPRFGVMTPPPPTEVRVTTADSTFLAVACLIRYPACRHRDRRRRGPGDRSARPAPSAPQPTLEHSL